MRVNLSLRWLPKPENGDGLIPSLFMVQGRTGDKKVKEHLNNLKEKRHDETEQKPKGVSPCQWHYTEKSATC